MAKERFGSVDILVNNAGITRDGLVMRMKEEDFDRVIEVNLKGVFNCIRAVTPIMVKQKYGKVINMASVVGITGNAGQVKLLCIKGWSYRNDKITCKRGWKSRNKCKCSSTRIY